MLCSRSRNQQRSSASLIYTYYTQNCGIHSLFMSETRTNSKAFKKVKYPLFAGSIHTYCSFILKCFDSFKLSHGSGYQSVNASLFNNFATNSHIITLKIVMGNKWFQSHMSVDLCKSLRKWILQLGLHFV